MGFIEILLLVVAIVAGLGAAIPLTIKLVKYIIKTVKSKNWGALMQLILKLMAEAEDNFKTGAERKEYVIDSIKAMEETLGYDIDETVVANMIDEVIKATKQINVKKEDK